MAREKKKTTEKPEPAAPTEALLAPQENILCPHVFVGGADSVQCAACGLKLTTEEFRELLKADN